MNVTILIGNSDDKLSQSEWSLYCRCIDEAVRQNCFEVHFTGGSRFDAPWQNACWVAVLNADRVEHFKERLVAVRSEWRQDSIAIQCGSVDFV